MKNISCKLHSKNGFGKGAGVQDKSTEIILQGIIFQTLPYILTVLLSSLISPGFHFPKLQNNLSGKAVNFLAACRCTNDSNDGIISSP